MIHRGDGIMHEGILCNEHVAYQRDNAKIFTYQKFLITKIRAHHINGIENVIAPRSMRLRRL